MLLENCLLWPVLCKKWKKSLRSAIRASNRLPLSAFRIRQEEVATKLRVGSLLLTKDRVKLVLPLFVGFFLRLKYGMFQERRVTIRTSWKTTRPAQKMGLCSRFSAYLKDVSRRITRMIRDNSLKTKLRDFKKRELLWIRIEDFLVNGCYWLCRLSKKEARGK